MSERVATVAAPTVARGYTRSLPPDTLAGLTKRAVVYLRVSSAAQAGTDYDAEGFSIPAQREACLRKAESIGASVVDEYVDAGESARSSDRPGLQAMLQRLADSRDIDYVIVHKVDRLARNRLDDVTINMAIREAGAQLVSVTENIDESPSGLLMHGIMSSIAEFYSKNLAAEINKGMTQKAKKGGLPGLAPVGYMNVRDNVDGKEIRTIAVDPDRALHVQWAFEAYASGDYTLTQLTEELAERGLTTRPIGRRPQKALARGQIHKLLKNPFYIGIVTWGGVQYEGRHEPLISVELFAAVQAVMASRDKTGEKGRKHNHYLKSTVLCARCQARLCFGRSRGNGGTYDYFFCLGRNKHRTNCDLPALSVAAVEEAVASFYANVQLDEEMVDKVRTSLLTALRKLHRSSALEAKRQRTRITRLEAKRRKLLQAHLAGAISIDLLKEQQDQITQELANAGGALASAEIHEEVIDRNITLALELLRDCHRLYLVAKPATRRHLNQAFFEALYVDVDGITDHRLAPLYGHLLDRRLFDQLEPNEKNPTPVPQGSGSNENALVEVMGLEPTTSTLRT